MGVKKKVERSRYLFKNLKKSKRSNMKGIGTWDADRRKIKKYLFGRQFFISETVGKCRGTIDRNKRSSRKLEGVGQRRAPYDFKGHERGETRWPDKY